MTAATLLAELEPLGTEGYRKTLARHGVLPPFFGVKISELKVFQKRIKKNYQLALDLYATGNYDAQYLAALVADDARMTKKDLQRWVKTANSGALASFAVPWVAAGSPHAVELAREWVESDKELIASAGWSTWTHFVSITQDAQLDLAELKKLLLRAQKEIHRAPNRVRLQMNYFVIGLGSFVAPLFQTALEVAEKIGRVSVDMGDTDCQVPFAPDYLRKVEQRGSIGKKRKSAKC